MSCTADEQRAAAEPAGAPVPTSPDRATPTDRGRVERRAVVLAGGTALVLHLLWWAFLSGGGGDLAAQDAWSSFAAGHPSSAYTFAWYGGMHPVSYSFVTPYLMGAVGVRPTLVVSGTVSAALVAVLAGRARGVRHQWLPGVYGALAMTGNAVSGRATFGAGVACGLGALVLAFPTGTHRVLPPWGRGLAIGGLAAAATACSPVAGLFIGLVGASVWLRGRRVVALALGLPPAVLVVASAVWFPFSGQQPIDVGTLLLALVMALACVLLLPWRTARVGFAVYAAAVVLVWVVPSPIGTNVVRCALLFCGVTLVAAATGRWRHSPGARRLGPTVTKVLLATAIAGSSVWQVAIAAEDAADSHSTGRSFAADVQPLVSQLLRRHADLGRVEVVPMRGHEEASALASYVNIARGWNRQADVARNPVFYQSPSQPISAQEYLSWLRYWSVRFVVVASTPLDYAGEQEAVLVRSAPSYLTRVWGDATWTLYRVVDPAPLSSPPSRVLSSDAAGVTVRVPRAGDVVVRVVWSPWLSLVDAAGERLDDADRRGSCLAERPSPRGPVSWVTLHAARPGTYRIGAPYDLHRGTPCASPEPA